MPEEEAISCQKDFNIQRIPGRTPAADGNGRWLRRGMVQYSMRGHLALNVGALERELGLKKGQHRPPFNHVISTTVTKVTLVFSDFLDTHIRESVTKVTVRRIASRIFRNVYNREP